MEWRKLALRQEIRCLKYFSSDMKRARRSGVPTLATAACAPLLPSSARPTWFPSFSSAFTADRELSGIGSGNGTVKGVITMPFYSIWDVLHTREPIEF